MAQTAVAGSGDYGKFTVDTTGKWSYVMNTGHDEFVGGTTYSDVFTVSSSDGTTSTITVNILGTNDAAVISTATANLTETNAVLSTSGTLTHWFRENFAKELPPETAVIALLCFSEKFKISIEFIL